MSKKQKNTLLEKITSSIQHLSDKKIVLACSGGVDSMVLLELFTHLLPSKTIIVAHVNHQLRTSALRDEKIVRDYCTVQDIHLEVLTIDIKKEAKKTKTTVEECARNVRMKWFEKIRKQYHADFIMTAHHADDQTETILYRITKGTSITGLVGIEDATGYYIRPLIGLTKREILQYAGEYSLSYGHDETNDDKTIPRNLLRHDVVDKLRIINPEVNLALSRLSQSARELKMSFDAFFTEVVEKKSFSLDWYHALPLGFQHELLRFLYEKAHGSTHGLSTALIIELDRFLSTRNGGKKEIKKLKLAKKQGKVYLT